VVLLYLALLCCVVLRLCCGCAETPAKPFIEEILETLPQIIRDLEPAQVLVFYEACATIIASQTVPDKRQVLVFKLMELPNALWTQIIARANQSTDVLGRDDTVKHISMVLKTNVRVAGALGTGYPAHRHNDRGDGRREGHTPVRA
jgi:hypothetical protein